MTEAFIRKKQAKSKFLAFGKRKLHPAAKMKRILSYSDHYFSYDNLKNDDFLLTELDANDDWVRISVLMTFPKILELIDPEKEANVVVDAFNSQKRFEVKGGEDPPTALVRKVKNRKPSVDIENNFPFHSPVEDSPHPTPKPKKINLLKNLPKYALPDTCEVVVARKFKQIAPLVARLRKSVGEKSVRALGFDLEYCTLDIDIRGDLPAVATLASYPDIVGIFWLDKMPDLGKGALDAEKCDFYQPLNELLFDCSIAKVGVGVHDDAANLANWCDIGEDREESDFFNGLLELNGNDVRNENRFSLADLCGLELNMRLNKKKARKRTKDRNAAHWRADSMTKLMKTYAAEDAMVGLEIFRKRSIDVC